MIEFKYRHYISFDKRGNLKVVYRPNAEVSLGNGSISKKFDMLVDSGADVSLIPKEMGEDLGLEIVSEEEIESIKGIGGEIPPVLGREDIFDSFRIEFLQDKKSLAFTR